MSAPANIRVNVGVPFPSLVLGSGPVTIAKVSGVWTVGFSMANLGAQVPALGNHPTDYLFAYDSQANSFFRITFNGLLASGYTRVANDFSVTSSAALVNVTGLAVLLAAGRVYEIEAQLFCTDAAAGGVQAALAASGGLTATSIIYEGYTVDSAANGIKGMTQATALGTAVGSTTTTGTVPTVKIRGSISVNQAGTLNVQFAQNTSNGTASIVKAGSFFRVRDIT